MGDCYPSRSQFQHHPGHCVLGISGVALPWVMAHRSPPIMKRWGSGSPWGSSPSMCFAIWVCLRCFMCSVDVKCS
eukprot:7090675-Pyramimonas_sp.AAC.1